MNKRMTTEGSGSNRDFQTPVSSSMPPFVGQTDIIPFRRDSTSFAEGYSEPSVTTSNTSFVVYFDTDTNSMTIRSILDAAGVKYIPENIFDLGHFDSLNLAQLVERIVQEIRQVLGGDAHFWLERESDSRLEKPDLVLIVRQHNYLDQISELLVQTYEKYHPEISQMNQWLFIITDFDIPE